MEHIWKYVAGAVVVLLLTGGGYYLLQGKKTVSVGQEGDSAPAPVATSTYVGVGFSLVHPADYTVDAAYAYAFGPKKLISGVKFTIPAAMATGTNLTPDSYLSVESLPRAKNCTGDIYLLADVKTQTIPENGIHYSVATDSGAGAGSVYEETVYAIEGSVPCTAVRYSIHSSNIGNYPQGTVREFDRAALIIAFDTIRQSLVLAH